MHINGKLTARTTKLRLVEEEMEERERGTREPKGLLETEEVKEIGFEETELLEET